MGKDDPKPMSRFWSCFFAGTIFALFWTVPMKTSIKWAALYVGMFALALLIRVASEIAWRLDNPGAILGVGLVSFAPLIIMIIVMYRWVTAYNLEQFGYTTRSEWEKARRDESAAEGSS